MHQPWVAPRARSALDRLERDRQQVIRDLLGVAASLEDGADRSKHTWLAAKRYEHFAEYIAHYDPTTMRVDLRDLRRLVTARQQERERRDRALWRRLLRSRTV